MLVAIHSITSFLSMIFTIDLTLLRLILKSCKSHSLFNKFNVLYLVNRKFYKFWLTKNVLKEFCNLYFNF